jgi:hypothetical protein
MGSGGITPRILNLGTIWRRVVSFTPRLLHPRGMNPGTHWIRSWVGSSVGLDVVAKRSLVLSRIELLSFST